MCLDVYGILYFVCSLCVCGKTVKGIILKSFLLSSHEVAATTTVQGVSPRRAGGPLIRSARALVRPQTGEVELVADVGRRLIVAPSAAASATEAATATASLATFAPLAAESATTTALATVTIAAKSAATAPLAAITVATIAATSASVATASSTSATARLVGEGDFNQVVGQLLVASVVFLVVGLKLS